MPVPHPNGLRRHRITDEDRKATEDTLRTRIAELEQDRERLDKLHRLLKAGATVYVNGDNETSIYLMDSIVGVEGPSYWHLREAIDAAREEKPDG